MKCVNHDEQEAVAVCAMCHKPVCAGCTVELSDRQLCRNCIEEKIGKKPAASINGRSFFWAFALSLLPGVGYLYLGLMKRGLQTMVVFYGTIFLAALTEFGEITALVLPVIMFYTIFDTIQLLKQMNGGQPVEDNLLFEIGAIESRYGLIGAVLIVIGTLALINNFLPYLPYHFYLRKLMAPVLILALGAYILYKNIAKRGRGDESNN